MKRKEKKRKEKKRKEKKRKEKEEKNANMGDLQSITAHE
jgi:hypothetical protein